MICVGSRSGNWIFHDQLFDGASLRSTSECWVSCVSWNPNFRLTFHGKLFTCCYSWHFYESPQIKQLFLLAARYHEAVAWRLFLSPSPHNDKLVSHAKLFRNVTYTPIFARDLSRVSERNRLASKNEWGIWEIARSFGGRMTHDVVVQWHFFLWKGSQIV